MGALLDIIYTYWNQFVYTLSNMRFPLDFLDIAIIAFIIYKAIGFLRETRSGQLVKGVVFLLLIYVMANLFKLSVLRWLLSALFGYAIIAFAIVFQPELRRILERMGQTNLTYALSSDSERTEVLDSLDKICKAAGQMSKTKTGALIVFERQTQLGEIINTGTVVDAKTSEETVGNIFFPNSPLHDGAVIVRDGRLYAAGCILPLTHNTGISSQLGTRHRAAIGMTENSDAVVLVVSEETGVISIAYNGNITRNHSVASAYSEIKSMLVDLYEEKPKNSVKSIFKKTIGAIIPKINNKKKEDNSNEN